MQKKWGWWFLGALVFLPASQADWVKGNEIVRLAGLGNTRVATSHQSGSLVGNPAAAINGNNLSFQWGLANLDYQSMIPQVGFHAQNQASLDFLPGFYYARPFGRYNLHIGFIGQFKNKTQIGMEHTRSEYIINEQRFLAKANLVSTYDLLWQSAWLFGLSCQIGTSHLGLRIKASTQRAKAGQILSSLNLDAQHGSDVNVNDPRALIPAVIDSLDFANPSQYLERLDDSRINQKITKYDLDFGYQSYFSFRKVDDFCVGIMVENMLQRRLIQQSFTQFGVGVSYQPNNWMLGGIDIFRSAQRFNFNFGLEVGTSWEKGFNGGLAVRFGIQHHREMTPSLGIQIALGGSTWNYAWQRKTTSIGQHFLGSAIRF